MIVAIFGRVTLDDTSLADLCGIDLSQVTGYVVGGDGPLPLAEVTLGVPVECIPLEPMIRDHYMAQRQNNHRVMLRADAAIIQGHSHNAEHLLSIARGYRIPVMELP